MSLLEAKDPLDHAMISLYAVHMPSGRVLIDENGQKSMTPSSCMKLVTAAAAFHVLGPEMRFFTKIAYDGKIQDGTLHGNVYIVGGGDPCLGSHRIPSSLSWKSQLEAWSEALQGAGVSHIEGKILVDDSIWEQALAVPDWSWEDLGNYYGAGASALSFHENAYTLFFAPGERVGEKALLVKIEPSLSHLNVQNEVTTGASGSGDQACVYGSEGSFLQKIRGTIPLGKPLFSIKGALPDPGAACLELFKDALLSKGVCIGEKTMREQEKHILTSLQSPTVLEIIEEMQKTSMNLYAEHLLKKMGEVEQGYGSTSSGTSSVKKFLEAHGLDLSGWRIADGSGLSRKNLLTAEQLVHLLIVMKKSEFFPQFFASLQSPTEGIRGKSGSMTLVRAYAGYAKEIAFAILINQCTDGKRAEEKIKDFFSFLLKDSSS
jgi:D-alanyl-D-alanine carboxypeptidase/D-alanyl-D-alanine-endopeptidase (penicillin-binding protein 4)